MYCINSIPETIGYNECSKCKVVFPGIIYIIYIYKFSADTDIIVTDTQWYFTTADYCVRPSNNVWPKDPHISNGRIWIRK